MSPEICAGQPYSFKTDVWALGCVLHELLCRRLPFEAPHVALLVKLINAGVPGTPPPAEYSAGLRALGSQLLAVAVSQRPDSATLLNHPLLRGKLRHVTRWDVPPAVVPLALVLSPHEAAAGRDAGVAAAAATGSACGSVEALRALLEDELSDDVMCAVNAVFGKARALSAGFGQGEGLPLAAALRAALAPTHHAFVPRLLELFAREEQAFG